MNNVDDLIKEILNNTPKRNTSELKSFVLNESILERLGQVQKLHNDNESKLLEVLNRQDLDINSVIKSLKNSNKLIMSSDKSIENLLKITK